MMKHKYIMALVCLLMVLTAMPISAQQPQTTSQSRRVKMVQIGGVVKEKGGAGQSLPGVSVVVRPQKGEVYMRYGTTTDLDGNFLLSVPAGSVVQFSCIGFEPVTQKVTQYNKSMVVYMEESVNMLKETVVIGYQNKSKADNTSAVTVIDAEDLTQAPVSNVMELLQGRVAGLNIQMNNGAPGASGSFTVRGISDISITTVSTSDGGEEYVLGSSAPLFVIDGIPQEDVDEFDSEGLLSGSGVSPLATLPFEDIADIQVLKDAAATSLYGSRGAYGVVLIHTKKGNSSKPQFDYSMDLKVNLPPRLHDVLAGRLERLSRINQVLENDTSKWNGYYDIHNNLALSDSLNPYFNNNTDWQANFYRRSWAQTHNLAVSGGNKKFNYKINGNYYTEDGIIKSTDFSRYGLRTNMGYSPNDRFEMSVNVNATLNLTGTGSGSSFSQKGVASAASASSLLPPPSMYSASNDALSALMIESEATSVKYEASVNLHYKLPWNIRWSGTAGYTYSNSEEETFTPATLNDSKAKIYGKSSNSYRMYGRTSLSYNTRIKMIRLGLTVGAEISSNRSTGNSITLSGLASDYLWGPVGYSSGSGTASTKTSDNTISFSLAPSFGIANMGAGGDKYIFNPTLRPEANSAYGRGVKWIVNPGLGFKWNYYLEPFMKAAADRWLDYGAIRVSWGRTTKYKADRYDVWGTYVLEDETYNGSAITPIDFDNMPNNNLDPVTTTQWNIGTDLYVFNRKIVFTADAYYKQVDNQLSSIELADHNAFDKIPTTDVSLVNYGLELGLNLRPLSTQSPFDLTVMMNLAINKDVITKLPNSARQIINEGATVVNKLGSNALSNYLYVYKGVYATDEDVPVDPNTGLRMRVGSSTEPEAYFRAGDPIWVDLNGDYIIDENDKMIVGNSQPRVTGGLAINLKWKNFSLYTNCSFVLRRDIINKVLADNFAAYSNPNVSISSMGSKASLTPISAYNFWTPDNIHADYPNPYDYLRADIIDPFRADQTLFMEDGSYFKINGITLSYSFPKRWTKFLHIRHGRIRLNMNNIYTFSNYSGINPENVNSLGQDTSSGYPSSRSFSMGLTIGF
ncbi:MAG: SusC/RagA family TonB-linked outer membrane protein [Bacteroides sp.]|nr:SusC/RagA family TonB-linked outer membrane protein [Bacteroides sp.]